MLLFSTGETTMPEIKIERYAGSKQQNNILRTDTINEVVRGLEFAAERLSQVEADSYQWKWVIIGLHSAMQNAMIAAGGDSAGVNVLSNGEKVYTALRNDDPIPVERVNWFPGLLELVKSDKMLTLGTSRVFSPTPAMEEEILRLN